ncbi:MAG: ribokinase [Steroidobacteraceae bacterium]
MSDVVVCGSLNMDLLAQVERLPLPGETVMGLRYQQSAGGKGLNQAIACARMGVPTAMIGAVGDDAHGHSLTDLLRVENVDTTRVQMRVGEPTGLAQVTLAASGENSIVVHAGANASLSAADAVRDLPEAIVYLAQLETPIETIEAFFEAASQAGGCRVLNTAPAIAGSERLLPLADVIVMNETELGHYLGQPDALSVAQVRRLAPRLLQRPQQALIVTLGAQGAWLFTHSTEQAIPATPATVVDTTGAGDCFTGVLAAGIALGQVLPEAARRASQAASVAVSRLGAASSMPRVRELTASDSR